MSEPSRRLLSWAKRHGRHNLPWQRSVNPYRVWVSEVMLQQTQAIKVIDYFDVFMRHFPDVQTLAQAPLDEVLARWAGLGYYSRARSLHRSAQLICEQYDAAIPANLDHLLALPGIGRSTAGAILAIGFGQNGRDATILDGNVRRVLARYFALTGYLDEGKTVRKLWQLAESLTPLKRAGTYAQAMMDLGALVCTPRSPSCNDCPLATGCAAFKAGRQAELPAVRSRRKLQVRRIFALLLQHDQSVLLERRPERGIWGGLWSLPEMATAEDYPHWIEPEGYEFEPLREIRHSFTHFKLSLVPVFSRNVPDQVHIDMSSVSGMLWYSGQPEIGLPAPIKKLVTSLGILNL